MATEDGDRVRDPKTVRMTPPDREEVRVSRRVPERMGPYRIEGELGRGGMGVVYVGLDDRLARRVAIKMVPEEMSNDPNALDDLENEARLLASLNHPNIATIYSLENIDGFRFFTLELIRGDSLAELLPRGKLSVAQRLNLFRQIAQALGVAHESGVIHCDLKPANIMVDARETAKILDFGIARALGRGPRKREEADVLSGTPGYVSPEQIAGLVPDERADVWAFGCLLYEALAGRRTFRGGTPEEVLTSTIRDEPDREALSGNLPDAVRDMVLSCLEKDPSRRLAEISKAAEILDGAAMSFRWQEADRSLSRTLSGTVVTGGKMPHFELQTGAGELVSSKDLLARGPLLVDFYRGRWCPVCTSQLVGFQKHMEEIASLGAMIVAISPQMQHHNESLSREHGLTFQLLSDPGNVVAKTYGVAFALPADLRSFHRSLGLDLREFNGDDSWVLPIPATFVVAQDGTIAYAATSPDPTKRPDPELALEALRGLSARP